MSLNFIRTGTDTGIPLFQQFFFVTIN